MKKPDGGSAFPKADTVENKDCFAGDYPRTTEGATGMSLRDYFAAAALTGGLAHGDAITREIIARESYLYADAMLAERIRKEE